jgi:outer membrane protein TolC/DNA-binding transcriptional ArsR family regulator
MARPAPSDPETDAFVGRMARVTAMEGFPYIGGRIFGLLLVSDRDLCLDEIAARLAVSKGSISSDARRLEQRGLLECVRRPGDRRDYYRVAEDLFASTMEMRLGRWKAFQEAVHGGRPCLRGRTATVRRRFDELEAAFGALTVAATRALAAWRRRRRVVRSGAGRAVARSRARSAARVVGALLLAAGLAAHRPLAAQNAAPALAPLSFTLGDAARLAARQSAPVDEARWQAEAAGERVRVARADLFPVVSGSAFDGQHTLNSSSFGITLPGFDPNGQIIGPVRSPDLRVSGALTLFDLSALRRVRSAGSGARAAQAGAAVVAEDAAARAAVAYVTLLRAEALLRARTQDSSLAWDLLDIARQGAAAGVSVALDVTRAEAQLAEARSDLIGARRDRDLARLALLRRLGLPLDAAVQPTDQLDGPGLADSVPSADSAVARALRGRPDVRAAAEGTGAARDRLSAIHAEVLPSVAVFGDEGVTGLSWGHLIRTYEYGLKISVPVFDGLRRSARAGEQAALVREAEAQERDARQQAEVEVRGALLDAASGREQVAAARERLRLADQEYAEARERFRTGVSGNADVVQASSSLNRARTRLVDALANLQTARVALARAQGAVTTLP